MTYSPVIIYCDAACASEPVNWWAVAGAVLGTIALFAIIFWLTDRYM